MPTGAVESIAKKYNVSIKTAEKEWADAKKIAEEQYGKSLKSPKSDKGKDKNGKIYGTAMNIFKNKMKAHHGDKKNESRLFRFDYFLNEDIRDISHEEATQRKESEEGVWYSHLKKLQDMFDIDHLNGPELETDIPKYVEGWLKYKQEEEDFASELTKYVEENYG